jgi:hypothetical protein
MAQPAPFAGVAPQRGHHRKRDQLNVGDLGHEPDGGSGRELLGVGSQQVIDGHIQCEHEVVEGGVHEAFSKVDAAETAPSLATSPPKPRNPHQQHQPHPLESLI